MPGTRADRNRLKTAVAQQQTRPAAQAPAQNITLSPAYTAPEKPAPSIPEVGRRIEQELAHLPQVGQPLSPAQEASLDLLDALAGELARSIPSAVLIERLPALGEAVGAAVRNAIREAGR